MHKALSILRLWPLALRSRSLSFDDPFHSPPTILHLRTTLRRVVPRDSAPLHLLRLLRLGVIKRLVQTLQPQPLVVAEVHLVPVRELLVDRPLVLPLRVCLGVLGSRLLLVDRHIPDIPLPTDLLCGLSLGLTGLLASHARCRRLALGLESLLLCRSVGLLLLHRGHARCHEGVHLTLGVRGVLALGADLGAVLVEQDGEGDHRQRDEAGEGGRPVKTERVVHLGGEERERCAEKRSEDRVGRKNRSGVDGVRVDQVAEDSEEDDDDAGTEGNAEHDGRDPVNVGRVGGSEAGQTDDDEDASPDCGWQTVLGCGTSAALLGGLEVLGVDVDDRDEDRQDGADEDTKEGQAADARVPPVAELEDDGVRGKVEVEDTVDERGVDGEDDDDRFVDEELPRSEEGRLEQHGKPQGLLGVGAETVDLASRLGQGVGALSQQHGRVTLGVEQREEHQDGTAEDRQEALDPSPSRGQAEETAGNGTEGGTEEWRRSEESHTQTALVGVEDVADHTSGVGEGRRTKEAGQEPEDEDLGDGLRRTSHGLPQREEEVRDDEDVSAAVDLGEWRPEQGAESEADYEKRLCGGSVNSGNRDPNRPIALTTPAMRSS